MFIYLCFVKHMSSLSLLAIASHRSHLHLRSSICLLLHFISHGEKRSMTLWKDRGLKWLKSIQFFLRHVEVEGILNLTCAFPQLWFMSPCLCHSFYDMLKGSRCILPGCLCHAYHIFFPFWFQWTTPCLSIFYLWLFFTRSIGSLELPSWPRHEGEAPGDPKEQWQEWASASPPPELTLIVSVQTPLWPQSDNTLPAWLLP